MSLFFPLLGPPITINRYPVPQTFATPLESPGGDERCLMVKTTFESWCSMFKKHDVNSSMVKPSLFCLDLRLMLKLFKDCSANACGTHAQMHTYQYTVSYLYIYNIESVRPPYWLTQNDGALGRPISLWSLQVLKLFCTNRALYQVPKLIY